MNLEETLSSITNRITLDSDTANQIASKYLAYKWAELILTFVVIMAFILPFVWCFWRMVNPKKR